LSDRTNEELLRRLRIDQTAFVEFYDRHVETVIRFAARRLRDPEAVADVVGAVFVELFETAGRYRPDRGSAVGWLYGVARNVVAEHRRRASREAGVIAKLSGRALVDADAYADLEARIDAEATARRLYEAMRALSERERAVLELVALEQMAVAEAAAVLGIRAGTARARLARARRRLRGLLGPLDEDRPRAGPALSPPTSPGSSALEATK
jgi:RNA polymerase sigma factor (sigma-70 family)